MRIFLASLVLLVAPVAQANLVNLPAETGAPVNEDDWSIPLRRCMRSTWFGTGVNDGAERCTMAFALPLTAGKKITRVRALYEDDDFTSQLELSFLIRDVQFGGNTLIASEKDNAAALTSIEWLWLQPDHQLGKHDAAFVLVEVQGDTRLLGVAYEYE